MDKIKELKKLLTEKGFTCKSMSKTMLSVCMDGFGRKIYDLNEINDSVFEVEEVLQVIVSDFIRMSISYGVIT